MTLYCQPLFQHSKIFSKNPLFQEYPRQLTFLLFAERITRVIFIYLVLLPFPAITFSLIILYLYYFVNLFFQLFKWEPSEGIILLKRRSTLSSICFSHHLIYKYIIIHHFKVVNLNLCGEGEIRTHTEEILSLLSPAVALQPLLEPLVRIELTPVSFVD